MELLAAAALGLLAGVLSGIFGVGGGILFVPTLTLVLGLTQLGAQATSLAAMIPVVCLGAWRQHRYGNVRWRTAALVGAASAAGVTVGVLLTQAVSDVTLRRLFAGLLLVTAVHLALSELRGGRSERAGAPIT